MREIVKKFAEEMEKILDEKSEKYQDGWKLANISELLESLNKQLKKIRFSDYENSIINANINKRNQRTLHHVANYCLLICNRLGYGKWQYT